MNAWVRYLVNGGIVIGPVLICMALVVYLLSPDASPQNPRMRPNVSVAARSVIADPIGANTWNPSSSESRPAQWFGPAPATSREYADVKTPEELAAHWEEQALSEREDLGTRGEALAALTQVEDGRAQYAFAALLASDKIDDRQLAVSLLRDWRERSGDPDGRITNLLHQAAHDTDEGVAYQARIALDPKSEQ
jgi:hypothetical protein